MVREESSQPLHVDTFLVGSGRPERSPGAPVNVAVELTSTYAADGAVNYARVGNPTWNMQWAFRGHIVVLCDEFTASDGEAFTEGFKRLGLGKVIGTRTWGGEIWLSFDNALVDNGIASAAETGVYGPEGKWLIEGHGVDPDIVVDNPPHATFAGEDAQLRAAIEYLQKEIQAHPVPVPPAPAYPNKAKR